MAGNRTLKLSILADVEDLLKKLKVSQDAVDSSSNKLSEFGKKAGLAFAAAAAAAGTMAIKIGIDAVKAASDLSETISKVGVIFGESSDDIEKFAAGAAKSLGQTKQQALDAAATFATFGKSAGLSGENLSKFSINFVKLASDLASFNNTSPEQAINAIGAALRGEAEPLRAYGVLLDDASMRQAALELGIINTTKNALTPQQKVLAAQELIYRQTAAAQGDFDRTSDGLANRTRILTAQLDNAKTTIGDALLPIVLELATFFSDKVIPIVESVANAFGSNKDKTAGVTGVLTTLVGTISDLVLPIFDGMKKAFDKIKNTVIENKDEFKGLFDLLKVSAPLIGTIVGKAFEVLGTVIARLINGFSTFVDLIGKVYLGLKKVIDYVKNNPIVSAIGGLFGSDGSKGLKAGTLSSANQPAFDTPQFGAARSLLPNAGAFQSQILANLDLETFTKLLGFANKSGIVPGNVFMPSADYEAGLIKAFDLMQKQNSQNMTGNAASANNITVNMGVVGDPESAARTIVQILNDSSYRGTGGAGAFTTA